MAVQRAAAIARRLTRLATQKGDYATGKAKGTTYTAATAARPEREYDDVTLARKAETELFRPADAPKDRVSANVVSGVVELRARCPTDADVVDLSPLIGSAPALASTG
jgi:hypothetical protein